MMQMVQHSWKCKMHYISYTRLDNLQSAKVGEGISQVGVRSIE